MQVRGQVEFLEELVQRKVGHMMTKERVERMGDQMIMWCKYCGNGCKFGG